MSDNICDKCGSKMVFESLNSMCMSNPPSRWLICMCGNKRLFRVRPMGIMVADDGWKERWKEENK